MSSRKIKKVVIPVAGLGSRFLPVTKAVPKELLPVVDKPIIEYIVREAVAADIECVVFVTSKNKTSVQDYFDPNDLYSYKLSEAKKDKQVSDLLELSKKIDIVSIRQDKAKGLGHAVWTAKPVIGSDEGFAVMLGDDIVEAPGTGAIGQCVTEYSKNDNGSVVGVIEVDPSEVNKYGIVSEDDKGLVNAFVEKPKMSEAPSNWALPGRYVFENEIFKYIENTPEGKNGEIQLTDAMQNMLENHRYFATKLKGERFDTGDKLGYIKANVSFALKDKRYSEELKKWLAEIVST